MYVRGLVWLVTAAMVGGLATPALAQTTTYRFHNEASTSAGLKQLRAAAPDAAIAALQTANLQSGAAGEKVIAEFNTAAGVPGVAGKIPIGATVSATVWMRKTANLGAMVPRLKIRLDSATGTLLCTATGTTPLTTTLTAYAISCVTTAVVTTTATSRLYVWAGVNLTTTASSGAFRGELNIEGTAGGNYDSTVTIPNALSAPTITSLTPASGGVGTVVTIAGTNFRDQQLNSTVTFSTNRTATVTSWSNTSIVATVPASTVTGAVRVTVAGTASTTATFTIVPPPTLTSLSPTAGGVGATVTLAGTNFGATQGASTVRFNGTVATPTAWSATSITAPVPAGATTGPVTVTVGGQVSAGLGFTVIPPPTLTALSPTSGGVGTAVTLTGTNFGTTQGTSAVRFNGTVATPTAWSATSITAPVPAGASSGLATVTVGGQSSGGVTFTVIPPPTLTTVSPAAGGVGAVVTLTGTNFGASQGASTVRFNGTLATPTAWSVTSITVPVPVGATSGPVTVTVAGQVSGGMTFTVMPVPTTSAITPTAAAVGMSVTLSGANFGSTQGSSIIRFNGTPAVPTAWSPTAIVVPVPAGAATGPVVVTVAGQISNGQSFTVNSEPTVVTLSLTEPYAGTTFNAPANLTVAATATITGGTLARLEFYDGALLIGTDTSAPYTVTWASPLQGAHSLTVVAVDTFNGTHVSTPTLVTIAPAGATLGTLATPTATPGAGVYGPGVSVALTAAPGAEIRYTRNGVTPTTASPLYTAPFIISSTETVRAKAFQVNWTSSAELVAAYQIDTTAPTIVATMSPAPNAAGWHHTAVTVSFMCSDANGVAICPEPIYVSSEGTDLLVSGTAVDAAGNQATATVTLSIDRTPPTVQNVTPTDGVVVSGNSVTVSAAPTDGLSGIADGTCDNQPATLVGSALTCDVALLGPTTILVHVVDVAGNGQTVGVSVSTDAPVTGIRMSPRFRSMVVDDNYDLVVVDQLGRDVSGASYASSDPTIAAVMTADTQGLPIAPVLVAAAPGAATITATMGTLTATLNVTVFAGPTLPVGTMEWRFGEGDSIGRPVPASYLNTLGVEFFAVDSTGVVLGLDSHGQVVFNEFAPYPTVGDARGGFLSVVGLADQRFRLVRTVAGGEGVPWVHDVGVRMSQLPEWAQGPEGTVYVVEKNYYYTPSATGEPWALTVLDGETGAVRARMALPVTRNSLGNAYLPGPTPPFVGRDGALYIGVHFYESTGTSPVTEHSKLAVVRVTPSGVMSVQQLRSYSYVVTAFPTTRTEGVISEVTADGQGGVLVQIRESTATPDGNGGFTYADQFDSIRVLPDGSTATFSRGTASPFEQVAVAGRTHVYRNDGSTVTAQDPLSGAVAWTTSLAYKGQPLQATADGGMQFYDNFTGALTTVDGTGAQLPVQTLPTLEAAIRTDTDALVGTVYDWSTWQPDGLAKVVTPQSTDYTVFPTQTGQGADQRRGRFGIYVKGHPAYFIGGWGIPQQHSSLRVVPYDQDTWAPILQTYERGSSLDFWGNAFVTYGAGNGDSDTGSGGVVTADRNRPSDRNFPPIYLTRVRAFTEEGVHVNTLNGLVAHYVANHNTGPATLPYKAVPNNNGDNTYNSNSFIRGLLIAADLPSPPITRRSGGLSRYPGWTKPIPQVYFGAP